MDMCSRSRGREQRQAKGKRTTADHLLKTSAHEQATNGRNWRITAQSCRRAHELPRPLFSTRVIKSSEHNFGLASSFVARFPSVGFHPLDGRARGVSSTPKDGMRARGADLLDGSQPVVTSTSPHRPTTRRTPSTGPAVLRSGEPYPPPPGKLRRPTTVITSF